MVSNMVDTMFTAFVIDGTEINMTDYLSRGQGSISARAELFLDFCCTYIA